MKIAGFSKYLLILLAAAATFAFTGCRKSPKTITPIPANTRIVPGPGSLQPSGLLEDPGLPAPGYQDASASPMSMPMDSGTGVIPSAPREAVGEFAEDRETFADQTVYFDFDRSNIKSSEMAKVESVAAFLKNEPATRLRVEGHCDERGTSGYNLALGERRALSVREYLVALGISPERITTVSFGEDRPADPGQSEEAWAKNRRAEFVVLRPQSQAQ